MKNKKIFLESNKELKYIKSIDKEEEEIINVLNNTTDIVVEKDLLKQAKIMQKSFKEKKDSILTLRINSDIKEKVKKRAEIDGLNYQTLINMLIFKYANGDLNLKVEFKGNTL